MALKLMYITSNPEIAKIADSSGVDFVFIDMEYVGKELRQAGMDTVKSHHTVEDVKAISPVLKNSKLLVRVNPIQPVGSDFDSEKEINDAIEAGADVLMLPMYKTIAEVERFVKIVNGRVKTMLLTETKEAAKICSQVVKIKGIDYIHIGLNDLHLSLGNTFMFEPLADGMVDEMCKTIRDAGITYGFGGIARIGYGMLPAEKLIVEHYRLGSELAILSRSFCNADHISDMNVLKDLFNFEINKIREYEKKVSMYSNEEFRENHLRVQNAVAEIVEQLKNK